jgi:FkbM family methyltransferase
MGAMTHNKLRTAWQIFRDIENWPTAMALRARQTDRRLRLLNFRNGLNLAVRGGTRDWDVAYELCYAGGYARALEALGKLPGAPVVLDLGGNIGLFSLLAARANANAEIFSFEPGPPNYRMFELNCLANSDVSSHIHLTKEAVSDRTTTSEWGFDEYNPGGSGFYTKSQKKFPVQIRAFSEILAAQPGNISLAKIDIEGSEYDLLAATPEKLWDKIEMIAIELHYDIAGKISPSEFLDRMHKLGFEAEQENVVSYFLYRR